MDIYSLAARRLAGSEPATPAELVELSLPRLELGLASQVNLIILLAVNLLNEGNFRKRLEKVESLDGLSPFSEMLFHEDLL